MSVLGTSISKNSVILGAFALVTAAIVAGTQLLTKDRIAKAERDASQRALLEIVPKDRHDNDLLSDKQAIDPQYWELLGLKNGGDQFIARDKGEAVAAIIPAVAPDGYSGDIKMIVGVNKDGTIAGVRVLSHHETPGLGDNVELKKSPWILGFDGKSLSNPEPKSWAVKKDGGAFDQFTGATITPRAVVKQVKHVLEYVKKAHPLKATAPNSVSPKAEAQPNHSDHGE